MAVAFDAASNAAAAVTSPVTWSHTNSAAGNAICVGFNWLSGSTPTSGTVTYGGVTLTRLGSIPGNNGTAGGIEVWGKIGSLPTGANTVSAAFSSANGTDHCCAGAVTFTGASTFGTVFTAFAQAGSVSVSVTGTTSGNQIFAAASYGNNTGTFTATSGTLRWGVNGDGAGGADNTAGGTWSAPGGTQAVGFSNTAGTDFWGLVAVEVQGAAAAPPGVSAAAPGQTWLRRFHHRQAPGWPPGTVTGAVTAGPPVYPLRGPVTAVRPSQLLPGRAASRDGVYAQTGPPVKALAGPAATRLRGLPPRGRTIRNPGTRAQTGAPVTALDGPVASRGRGLPPRGRTSARAGVYAQQGAPVTALDGPVRTRPQPPPRGRAQARYGTFTSTAVQAGPPVTPLRGPVAARFPGPFRKGRTATMAALPLFYPGPPVYPLRGPVRTRPQPPPRGRAAWRYGTFTAVGVQAGPPVYPLRGPVAARVPLPRRGRCAGSPGSRAQTGPPVTPLRGPVAARRPSLLPGGRCQARYGTFTQTAIQSGPPVYPLHGPVRTRTQPPPRGRCAGNRGTRAQPGPPVTPLRGPVAPFRPGPYRSGRCAANRGTRAQLGPAVRALPGPVRSRVPHRTRGGHSAGSPGAPVFVPPFSVGALTAATAARGQGAPWTGSTALTAATAATGTQAPADKPTGGGAASVAPLGGITATDI